MGYLKAVRFLKDGLKGVYVLKYVLLPQIYEDSIDTLWVAL